MSKEKKQDRLARSMVNQVTEHLHELKMLDASAVCKESDIEKWAHAFLKNCLGYMSSEGYSIRSQETKGKHRPDLIVMKHEKPVMLVEVKKLNFNLNKSDFRSGKTQMAEYLKAMGTVRWGILTNGTEWRLYDFSVSGGIEIASFDLKENDSVIDLAKGVIESLCFELLDFHEEAFDSGSWLDLSKEATVFSPETLARAILSNDVIKYIAKTIRGEFEFRVNHEMLTDRVHEVLEQGLDDSVAGWNEVKMLELQKYVKSQKRANRKIQRAKAQKSEVVEPSAVDAGVTAAEPLKPAV